MLTVYGLCVVFAAVSRANITRHFLALKSFLGHDFMPQRCALMLPMLAIIGYVLRFSTAVRLSPSVTPNAGNYNVYNYSVCNYSVCSPSACNHTIYSKGKLCASS